MGRPSTITPEVVVKLEKAFMDGANITQACIVANISRDAYYDRVKSDERFANDMEAAQSWVSIIARKNLVDEIRRKNPMISLTWLERKDKAEFAPRQELTGGEGQPLGYIHSGDLKKIDVKVIDDTKKLEPKQTEVGDVSG